MVFDLKKLGKSYRNIELLLSEWGFSISYVTTKNIIDRWENENSF